MARGWQRKGSPTLTVAEENLGSSSVHVIKVPAGTTMSRVTTTPLVAKLSAAWTVAATPRKNTTSMRYSGLNFILISSLNGARCLHRMAGVRYAEGVRGLNPATHISVALQKAKVP